MKPKLIENRGLATRMLLIWAVLAACSVWALWNPTILEWQARWVEDPTYSHGFLVPLFALGLLWWKRRELLAITPRPTFWGVPVIAVGAGLHFLASYYFFHGVPGIALLFYLAGGALVVGGWPLLKHTWQAIGFLFFMVPLPYRVETALRGPLMEIATKASTFLLQLFGLSAFARGNIIDVDKAGTIYELGVVEACSGLKMLITFVALAVAMVIITKRPLVDKIIILLSAVPIAVVSNIIRITATGVLYILMDEKTAEWVYHDLAGYLMMPLGLGLLWLEMKILDNLFVERPTHDPEKLRPIILGTALGITPQPKPKRKFQ